MAGQAADRLLVTGEGVERGRQLAQQRVAPALRGEGDLDGSDRLGVLAVDDCALMAAECSDAIAGPQEREVRADHRVKQAAQVRLDPPLHRRLEFLRVGVIERPAAQQDPRPVPQIDVPERALLQPDPPQTAFIQPGQGQERVILVISRGILGADGQQQERFHLITLVSPGP